VFGVVVVPINASSVVPRVHGFVATDWADAVAANPRVARRAIHLIVTSQFLPTRVDIRHCKSTA
jgi:hypothetical protein